MKYDSFNCNEKLAVAKQVEQKVIDLLTEVIGIKGFKVNSNVKLTDHKSFEVTIQFESTPCRHSELERYSITSDCISHYWCKECHQKMEVKEE
jgi:hypothetical protein